jgi:hypothetical protein
MIATTPAPTTVTVAPTPAGHVMHICAEYVTTVWATRSGGGGYTVCVELPGQPPMTLAQVNRLHAATEKLIAAIAAGATH